MGHGMLLTMSAWMRLMMGEVEMAPPPSGALTPEQDRIRRALTGAVTAHPLHRELVHVHQMGGCQYFAFAGALVLDALGCGRAEVALGRVAFRTGRRRWIGYPAARADLRIPDPAQERQEAEAFQFHAWIRLTGPDGRRRSVDFDLSNVLREARLNAPLEVPEFHRGTPAFWGTAAEARRAGLRFEARHTMTADALMPGDRKVFQAIADDARARLS